MFEEEIEVLGSAGGQRDMVYVRLPDKSRRGVPAWMFDPIICAGLCDRDDPVIELDALLRLVTLIDSASADAVTVNDESTKDKRTQDNAGDPTGRPNDAAPPSPGQGADPGAEPLPVHRAAPADDAMRNPTNNKHGESQ